MNKSSSELSSDSPVSDLNVYLVWRSDQTQIDTGISSCVDILHQLKAYRNVETILSEIRCEGGEPFLAGAPISDQVPVGYLESHFRCGRLDLLVDFDQTERTQSVTYTIVRKPLV